MDKFDLSRVPENGFLIFPISMSRIANAHSPENIYSFLQFFESKIPKVSIDVVVLYTDGLYINTAENALEFRQKTVNQILDHKAKLLSLILKERKYVPQAFHFLPWDYVIVNSLDYLELKKKIDGVFKEDNEYQKAIEEDLRGAGRKPTKANINFLIEETVVSHLLLQRQIPLPHALTSAEGWRLICYPGVPISSWKYLTKNNLLPTRKDLPSGQLVFSENFYNMESKVLESLAS